MWGTVKRSQRQKQYIEEHFNDSDISLNKVAKLPDSSPSYFSTLFNQEIGMSFVEYLTNYRMEKARAHIKEGHVRLQDLAEQVGYADPLITSVRYLKSIIR